MDWSPKHWPMFSTEDDVFLKRIPANPSASFPVEHTRRGYVFAIVSSLYFLENRTSSFPSKSSLIGAAIIIWSGRDKTGAPAVLCSSTIDNAVFCSELSQTCILVVDSRLFFILFFWCWELWYFWTSRNESTRVLWLMRYWGSGNDGFNYSPGLV